MRYFLIELLIKCWKYFQVTNKYLNSLRFVLPEKIKPMLITPNSHSSNNRMTIIYSIRWNTKKKTYRSRASKYFCFLISKNIFIEYLLSSTLVNPDKYFSTSSHSPAWTFSSKYFMLKKNPDSCSSLYPFTKNSKIQSNYYINISKPFIITFNHFIQNPNWIQNSSSNKWNSSVPHLPKIQLNYYINISKTLHNNIQPFHPKP